MPPPLGFESSIVTKFSSVVTYILEKTNKKIPNDDTLLDVVSRLSVDNMAWVYQDGTPVTPSEIKAPYRITLVANEALYAEGPKAEKSDFRVDLENLQPNTVLWKVYGVDRQVEKNILKAAQGSGGANDPHIKHNIRDRIVDEKNLIGTIVLEKPFASSNFANKEIMYKHFVADIQQREELDNDFKTLGESQLRNPLDYDAEPSYYSTEVPTGRKDCFVEKSEFANSKALRLKQAYPKIPSAVEIVTSDIAPFCLQYGNTQPGFPEELKGVWWMNGNFVPETLATFSDAKWDQKEKALTFNPGGPGNWAWYASPVMTESGKVLDETAGTGVLNGNFNSTLKIFYDSTTAVNRMDLWKKAWLPVPADLARFTLVNPLVSEDPAGNKKLLVSELSQAVYDNMLGVPVVENDPATVGPDMYLRRSEFLRVPFVGKYIVKGDYRLTRIIGPNGEPTINFPLYLEFLKQTKLTYTAIYKPTVEVKTRTP